MRCSQVDERSHYPHVQWKIESGLSIGLKESFKPCTLNDAEMEGDMKRGIWAECASTATLYSNLLISLKQGNHHLNYASEGDLEDNEL